MPAAVPSHALPPPLLSRALGPLAAGVLSLGLQGCAELALPAWGGPQGPAPAASPAVPAAAVAVAAAASAVAPAARAVAPAAGAVVPAASAARAAPRVSPELTPPKAVQAYGPGPLQYGELRLPPGEGPFPVALLIHGGCWTQGFATLGSMAALASVLPRFGIATWNIEYRQLGDAGGGWPGTLQDWAAAADALRQLQLVYPLDLSRVVAVGHSAGGQAALWLAARAQLPRESAVRGGAEPLPLLATVNIDGPVDLAGFIGPDSEVCGQPAVVPLMGGTPAEQPEHYRQASPLGLLPLRVPQYLVSAKVLRPEGAQAYASAARTQGDEVEVLTLPDARHFDPLQPVLPAGEATRRFIVERAFTPPFASSTSSYRCAAGKRLSAAYLNLRGGEAFAVLQWQGRQEVLRAASAPAAGGAAGLRYQALPGPASSGLVWQTQGLPPAAEGLLSQEQGPASSRTLAFDCKPER